MTNYHSPGSIRYREDEIIWLIKFCLDGNVWPTDHRETGYSGSPKRKVGHTAPFEATKVNTAEVLTRLRACGLDGLNLEYVLRLSDGDDVYLIQRAADYQHRSYEDVKEGIRSALKFCCGWRRKRDSYSRYRQKYVFRRSRRET